MGGGALPLVFVTVTKRMWLVIKFHIVRFAHEVCALIINQIFSPFNYRLQTFAFSCARKCFFFHYATKQIKKRGEKRCAWLCKSSFFPPNREDTETREKTTISCQLILRLMNGGTFSVINCLKQSSCASLISLRPAP